MYHIILCIIISVHGLNRKQQSQLKLNSFPAFWSPESKFDSTIPFAGKTQQLQLDGLKSAATKWVANNLAMSPGDEVVIKNAYTDTSTGLHFCYMSKKSQGFEIANSASTLTMDSFGNVLSQGNHWVSTDVKPKLVKRGEGVTCKDAAMKVGTALGFTLTTTNWKVQEYQKVTVVSNVGFTQTQDITCEEKLYKTPQGSLLHVWDVTSEVESQYLNVMVNKANGNIVGAADWTSHLAIQDGRLMKRQNNGQTFQYRAIPIGGVDPIDTKPKLLVNPADPTTSPLGWHFAGKDISFGNNVFATENSANQKNLNKLALNGRQANGTDFTFDFTFDDKNQKPSEYRAATITNVFVVANQFHDILYHYGFDEKAGNFQFNNNGKTDPKFGGDPVLALVQDGSGKNNANFGTPPDGKPGVMKMFIFDRAVKLGRDGGLDNSVVIHELTHGLSNRLTGGAALGNCLQKKISASLGEGWSDAVAVVLEMTGVETRNDNQLVGRYVTNNNQKGIRSAPYSTNLKTNNLTFSALVKRKEVHQVGEVWASMLFEVYWNMVDRLGFDQNFKTSSKGTGGNTKFLQVLVNGMKMQPCNPTFIQARDAIVTADRILNNGNNFCDIMKGFAKRGMGVGARDNVFRNSFTIPSNCV
ncbi:Fungalysin/Thermolysin Extracellular metalloproteinase 5 [Globomyces sp. JEL0801]|nr:Fungalysin/Thermolysin Extracellular metalloproteinase 5 [Globomyces sp. JEL0801]